MLSLVKQNGYLPSIFDDFFTNDLNFGFNERTSLPKVNVLEEKDSFKIEFAVPGFEKEDFKVELNKDLLTISANKSKEEKEEKDKRYSFREFSYSSFTRSFVLPEDVDTDSIDAEYKNGILNLNLKKKEAVKEIAARVVEIK